MRRIQIIACVCVLACANAAAQDAVMARATANSSSEIYLPTGQSIPLASDKEWSSATLKQGDVVTMHVSEDVMLDGRVAIPSGTPASGEVIDSQSGGIGGKPGKLSISAREIHLGDRTIALRSRLLAGNGVGKDRSKEALAASFALGPFAMFVHGSDITIPADTSLSAKLALDTTFAPAVSAEKPLGNPVPSEPPTTPAPTTSPTRR